MVDTASSEFNSALEAAATQDARLDRAKRAGHAVVRRKRLQDFTLFKRIAQEFFSRPPFDPGHQRMAALAGFGLAIGGDAAPALAAAPTSSGAQAALSPDARTVEAYYGERRISSFQRFAQERLRHEWAEVVETGASLLYRQGDDGVVTVMLYPAQTQTIKPEEDAIQLARWTDLEAMTGRGALERQWRALRAYAEVTSLDGEPTTAQQLEIAWLRYSRPTLRDGRRRPAKLLGSLEAGLRFTAAIAAAALLLTAAL